MDDFELLQAYADRRAEDAFTKLTRRYINLVYSAALRQTANTHAAEDVTQAVFLTLARKAGSISRQTILSGWLLRTTRFASANARRLEQRREHYEQQAMQSSLTESESAWQRLAPVLDEALDQLGDKDRDAIILRFFEQKSLKQVGDKLNLSEDSAQKRVSRALEKLRLVFTRRGKGISAAVLASALAAHSVQAAPATLSASIAAAVGLHGGMAGSVATALTDATLQTLSRVRMQSLAARIGSVAVLLGILFLTMFHDRKGANDQTVSAPQPTPVTGPKPVVAPPTRVTAAAIANTVPPDTKTLLLHVLDAQSGTPVENARLTFVSTTQFPQRSTNILVSDATGSSTLSYSTLPVKYWSHRIEIFRDGYVPKYLSWSESQADQMAEIPAEYTVKVDRAVTIGAQVVDEQNNPVSDVSVIFSVSGPTDFRSRERSTMMGGYHTKTTDSQGRWSCSHVPAKFGMIQYKLIHPQFQDVTYFCDSPEMATQRGVTKISESEFLAQTAVMRLKRGLAIAGIVNDETGAPISEAKVTQGFAFGQPDRNMLTGADGSFRFSNGRPGDLRLTVQAANFAPVVTSFVMNASIENLQIALPLGRLLRGRIVDEAGESITGATVEAASPTADSRVLFEWRAKTDAEGRFSWDAAPAIQDYAIYASGYELHPIIKLTADGNEQLIQMKKKANTASVLITGRVLDAETKRAPALARVQIWQDGSTTRPQNTESDGRFRIKTSSGRHGFILEAQAEAYAPERLTNDLNGATEVNLTIELKKAPLYAGIVLTPGGEPANGATLAVCGPNEWAVMLDDGKLQIPRLDSVVYAHADAQGKFQLPPKHSPHALVAVHPQGFTEIPFTQVGSNSLITLQPWGRIEGTAQIGSKPLASEEIRVGSLFTWRGPRPTRVSLNEQTATDKEGHFTFAFIPPGEWQIARHVGSQRGPGFQIPLYSHGVSVSVRPDETARVLLGGYGRTVTGKADLPEGKDSALWTNNAVTLTAKRPADDAIANQAHEYRAMFAADGSFRIDGVPPGQYVLKVNLAEAPKSPGAPPIFNSLGSLTMDVTIPESNEQPDESPIDLGLLHLL